MEQHNKATLCCNLVVWSIDLNSEWVTFLNRNFTTTKRSQPHVCLLKQNIQKMFWFGGVWFFFSPFFFLKTITSNTSGNKKYPEKNYYFKLGRKPGTFSCSLDLHCRSICPRIDNFHIVILWGGQGRNHSFKQKPKEFQYFKQFYTES